MSNTDSAIYMNTGLLARSLFGLRALCASLIINFPILRELWLHGIYTRSIFNDWDEPFYLKLAVDGVSNSQSNSITSFKDLSTELYHMSLADPYLLNQVVTSTLVKLGHLDPAHLGIILDLFVVFICYLLFSKVFSVLFQSKFIGETANIALLFLPEMGIPFTYFNFHWHSLGPLVFGTVKPYVCLPILRGAATQLSYLPFALWLWSLIKAFREPDRERYHNSWAGIGCALGLYFYLYAWVAMFLATIIFECTRLHRKGTFGAQFFNAVISLCTRFVPFSILFATPMFVRIFAQGDLSSLELPNAAKGLIYVPLELFAYSFLILILIRIFIDFPLRGFLTCFVLALGIGEFLGVNVQSLFGNWFGGYHIPLYYYYPLFSAVLIGTILTGLRTRMMRITGIAILFIRVLFNVFVLIQHNDVMRESRPYYGDLLRVIETQIENRKNIVTMPYEEAFIHPECVSVSSYQRLEPLITRAIIDRPYLPLPRTDWTSDSEAKRELLLGLLFHGNLAFPFDCNDTDPVMPGDIFTGILTLKDFSWRHFSKLGNQIKNDYSACQAIKEWTVDYILWEPTLKLVKPEWLTSATQAVWESPDKKYELLKFDSAKAQETLCS